MTRCSHTDSNRDRVVLETPPRHPTLRRRLNLLTMQTYVWKQPLEINFIYLGNKEIYCIFKKCCIMFYFSQNVGYFVVLSFSVQIILLFINHMLKFKYPPWCDKSQSKLHEELRKFIKKETSKTTSCTSSDTTVKLVDKWERTKGNMNSDSVIKQLFTGWTPEHDFQQEQQLLLFITIECIPTWRPTSLTTNAFFF